MNDALDKHLKGDQLRQPMIDWSAQHEDIPDLLVKDDSAGSVAGDLDNGGEIACADSKMVFHDNIADQTEATKPRHQAGCFERVGHCFDALGPGGSLPL